MRYSPRARARAGSPSRAQPESRRDVILAAAADAFHERGYEAASLRDIARQAGITQAAVYYHFRSKEDILFTLISDFSDDLFTALMSALSKDADPVARLRHAIVQHILFTKTHRKLVKLVMEDTRSLSPGPQALVKQKERAIFNLYRGYVRELQEAGTARGLDLVPATFSLFGVINSLYHWYRPDQRLSIEEVAEEIAEFLLHGLLRAGAADRAEQERSSRR